MTTPPSFFLSLSLYISSFSSSLTPLFSLSLYLFSRSLTRTCIHSLFLFLFLFLFLILFSHTLLAEHKERIEQQRDDHPGCLMSGFLLVNR